MLRFSPLSRFRMAVTSYTGAFTVMDTQSKRTLLKDKLAHTAPCADVCWSPISNDSVLTVGYDCHVKMYDLRTRCGMPLIKSQHPLSTIDWSRCGNYICGGNLKGGIFTYDLRHMSETPLCLRPNAHDGIVQRVSFLPFGRGGGGGQQTVTTDDTSDLAEEFMSVGSSSIGHHNNRRSSVLSTVHEDGEFRRRSDDSSFLSFLEKRPPPLTAAAPATTAHPRKYSIGDDGDSFFELAIPKFDYSVEQTKHVSLAPVVHLNDSKVNCNRRKFVILQTNNSQQLNGECAASVDNNNVNGPQEMKTIANGKENVGAAAAANDVMAQSRNRETMFNDFAGQIENNKVSTPTRQKLDAVAEVEAESDAVVLIPVGQQVAERAAPALVSIDEKFRQLEENMQKRLDAQEKRICTQVLFNLWAMDDGTLKEMSNGIAGLCRSDAFLMDYDATKEENPQLKQRIKQLERENADLKRKLMQTRGKQ